jgi:hypothetical protein
MVHEDNRVFGRYRTGYRHRSIVKPYFDRTSHRVERGNPARHEPIYVLPIITPHDGVRSMRGKGLVQFFFDTVEPLLYRAGHEVRSIVNSLGTHAGQSVPSFRHMSRRSGCVATPRAQGGKASAGRPHRACEVRGRPGQCSQAPQDRTGVIPSGPTT